MSNDAEHRAAFGLIPGCDLTAGGIKDIEVLTGTLKWPGDDYFNREIFNDPPKHTEPKPNIKYTINPNYVRDAHPLAYSWFEECKETDNVVVKQIIMERGRATGKTFEKNNLKKSYNVMNCPRCGMPCDKTHDGHIGKVKYEFFHCYECKKNFKITL